MDPTVTAPTLGGLGGLPPPGVDEVVTTGYAGGPLGVALPPPARGSSGLHTGRKNAKCAKTLFYGSEGERPSWTSC